MSYTAKLRIDIPVNLLDTGKKISRALDPDVGGSESWTVQGELDAPTGYFTETPCTPEFAAQATAMLGNPEMLFSVVSVDYKARWADLEAPTLEECAAFCTLAKVSDPTVKAETALNLPEQGQP